MRMPPIKSVMTPFPHAVGAEVSLDQARGLMEEHGIHHLPVMEGNRLVGLISDRDLARAGRRGLFAVSDGRTVGEICSREVYVVDLEEPLDNVLVHMVRERSESALVVKEGKLAGIFTPTDACRAFAEHLRRDLPPSGDHAA